MITKYWEMISETVEWTEVVALIGVIGEGTS